MPTLPQGIFNRRPPSLLNETSSYVARLWAMRSAKAAQFSFLRLYLLCEKRHRHG